MIAALYVETGGAYFGLPNVDPWDAARDARQYAGPWPVVAHPPCKRWGRYWSGGPSAKVRRKLGDDDGCFEAALASVRKFGGVIEHPEASHAWLHHGLNKPPRFGGWVTADWLGGWTCCVEQGHYGHRGRKATWLYAIACTLPTLIRGPSSGVRLDAGFHTSADRRVARGLGILPVKRMAKNERLKTPPAFRDLLIAIAESVRR